MRSPCEHKDSRLYGSTSVEVMIAALLIFIGLGSILSMNATSIHTLRATRQAAASSQVLQERIEMIRSRMWPEISNAPAMAGLMAVPTDSERELADANLTEFIRITVPQAGAPGTESGGGSFSLRRQSGVVTVESTGDLGSEPTLLVESALSWRDVRGVHQRQLRTLVCRAGLTRSGIFGSPLGSAAARNTAL